jgi:hypothetical protein
MSLDNLEHNSRDGNFLQPRALVITGIVFAAAALRVAPHPKNFVPIGALALFGGAYFSRKRAAIAIPLLSLVAGDIFVGFHLLIPYVYASFLVSVAIGFWLRRKRSAPRIGAATLAGAIQFFWSPTLRCGFLRSAPIRKPRVAWRHAISQAYPISGILWQATGFM